MVTRQSQRIRLELSLELEWRGERLRARTADVNDTGALVLSSIRCAKGDVVVIRSLATGVSARFTIVRTHGEGSNGGFGCCLRLDPREPTLTPETTRAWASAFWGDEYQRAQERAEGARRARLTA